MADSYGKKLLLAARQQGIRKDDTDTRRPLATVTNLRPYVPRGKNFLLERYLEDSLGDQENLPGKGSSIFGDMTNPETSACSSAGSNQENEKDNSGVNILHMIHVEKALSPASNRSELVHGESSSFTIMRPVVPYNVAENPNVASPQVKTFSALNSNENSPISLSKSTVSSEHISRCRRQIFGNIDAMSNSDANATYIHEQSSNNVSIPEHDASKKRRKRAAAPRHTKLQRAENFKNDHPIRPPCNTCKKKCSQHTKLSQPKREEIWSNFWQKDFDGRRDWLSRHVTQYDKRSTTVLSGVSRRRFSIQYQLEEVNVCKLFFISTLGLTQGKFIQSMLQANREAGIPLSEGIVKDKRGHKEPGNKHSNQFNESIRGFVMSLRPTVTHYRKKSCPYRRYIPLHTGMHSKCDIFKAFCASKLNVEKCSLNYFKKIFKEMNIGFGVPEQDKCTFCEQHKLQHENSAEHDCAICNCDNCTSFLAHMQEVKDAAASLSIDKSVSELSKGSVIVATADMQKTILVPKLPIKDYFFSRKLVLFNETFALPGKGKPGFCILWHEGEAGRSASNVASSYMEFLKCEGVRDANEIIIYADNCSAQNKNYVFFNSLILAVNDPSITCEKLAVKHFVVGHTYMASDAIHGLIGTAMGKREEICDLSDFVSVIKNCRENLNVVLIDHKSMYEFIDNARKKIGTDSLRLADYKVFEFRKGSTSMFVKRHILDADYIEIDFLNKKSKKDLGDKILAIQQGDNTVVILDSIQKQKKPRGIPKVKKDDLMKLCASMKKNRTKFFEDLVVNDVVADLEVEEEIQDLDYDSDEF